MNSVTTDAQDKAICKNSGTQHLQGACANPATLGACLRENAGKQPNRLQVRQATSLSQTRAQGPAYRFLGITSARCQTYFHQPGIRDRNNSHIKPGRGKKGPTTGQAGGARSCRSVLSKSQERKVLQEAQPNNLVSDIRSW